MVKIIVQSVQYLLTFFTNSFLINFNGVCVVVENYLGFNYLGL